MEIEPLVGDLLSLVTLVSPRQDVHVVAQDPSDNLFIAIALESRCPLIVSGDHHLLAVRQYQDVRVVSAAEFVRTIQTPGP